MDTRREFIGKCAALVAAPLLPNLVEKEEEEILDLPIISGVGRFRQFMCRNLEQFHQACKMVRVDDIIFLVDEHDEGVILIKEREGFYPPQSDPESFSF